MHVCKSSICTILRRSRQDVLAIPAGGVPVGVEISKRLNLPLDLAVVRKIHIPWNREAGFGAMAWDGIILLNEDLVKHLELSKKEIDDCIAEEREEIEKRMIIWIRQIPGDCG
ncbi:MAG: Phosphoribosyl transferase domain protein [Candidatus Methanolliviera sp. GoM_oil]|nr:MAG: Phosphoribosyl transferase domain protein [Candidatus Methanolliviera sp. GoM_oil]